MRFIQDHCNHKECKNKHHAKGFCNTHYTSYRKTNKTYKKNNNFKLGNFTFNYKDRTNWSLSVKETFSNKCMLCGWQEASCDVHHIIPFMEGGENTLQNAIVLCPNHHKLADIKKLNREYLQNITNNRIESILEELKGD
jgi:hypothetical protein